MNANVKIALVILVLIIIWFVSGLVTGNSEITPADDPAVADELTKVRVRWVEAEDYSRQISARGRTAPNRHVTLRAEVSGRVIAVPADKGQAVDEGDTICELAEEDREQRVLEAQAAVAQAEIDYRGALKLKEKGYQSDSAIAQANARLESTRAALRLTEINLANTRIAAPFAGFVDDRPVEVGDYMDRNHICAEIVEMNPLKVVARLSEREVVRAEVGGNASVRLATGQLVTGEVTYLSHLAEPQTRTYEMEITLPNPSFQLRAGVASQVMVATNVLRAHRVPASLLALGDGGELGLKIVNRDDRVDFVLIDLVGDDGEGVWIAGLPERTRVITVGQEYVSAGEQVAAEEEEAAPVLPEGQSAQ
ncbi:efflux RND transporter periplasmic adaptor subunit [uncultured Porticoccus sp.]|uniref:efflux RND transporter periplasmic adaptor subunit n=1 Tax=uncultured Porticoccus sp. TaxID=1256050 RepID=UPI00262F1185|nr:efflux RND transporter periplasmic adaptor subunit [uncultured Porticoccus sp.]